MTKREKKSNRKKNKLFQAKFNSKNYVPRKVTEFMGWTVMQTLFDLGIEKCDWEEKKNFVYAARTRDMNMMSDAEKKFLNQIRLEVLQQIKTDRQGLIRR